MCEHGDSRTGEPRNKAFANVPILVYHEILEDGGDLSGFDLGTPVGEFDRQMHFLQGHGYQSLTLTELLECRYTESPKKQKSFVLTFDDGYEDVYTRAIPILTRYGFGAVVFLVVESIRLEGAGRYAGESTFLSWSQIRYLSGLGVSFGSHTISHPHLPQLSKAQIKYELTMSKDRLEQKLGWEIPFLAYPYGESTAEIEVLAREAGYKAACGVITGRRSQMNLWRRPCRGNDSLRSFAFKMSRSYDDVTSIRQWAREDTAIGRLLRTQKQRWFPPPS